MKSNGEKIVGLTAWDYLSGKFADKSGAEIVLVGDSLSMTIRGDKNTLSISLEEMIYHSRMVARAVERAIVIGDMPFMSYQVSPQQALENAGRFVKEGMVQAVKIEGGRIMAETVKKITKAGIPVMGHIGLTPQSIHQVGGLKVQAKQVEEARDLVNDALSLEEAGAFCVVLECVPAPLAGYISNRLTIPTIGIGAGSSCDGQIQVSADVLGLLTDVNPKHAKKYANLAEVISRAYSDYVSEVKQGIFPTEANSFPASTELLKAIEREEFIES